MRIPKTCPPSFCGSGYVTCAEPGGVSTLLLEWLLKQCNHPAQGRTFSDRLSSPSNKFFSSVLASIAEETWSAT